MGESVGVRFGMTAWANEFADVCGREARQPDDLPDEGLVPLEDVGTLGEATGCGTMHSGATVM